MKRICLDTDFLVALLRKHPEAVKKAEEYDSTEAQIATTSMNAFEIYLGAFRSRNAETNVKQADDLLNSIKTLYLNLECSRKAGEILSNLLHIGESIDLRDAIIAGITIVNGYTLVTRNLEHFKRITGLSTEPW
ncbi:type II toxin-antitoxin system VapC family toxin [Candidatus Bathyarchaeota archaeon]|nr:type II toxin-antitoxin system VapC family toxin [Candidatus Bathyarchaeota archaeon]